MNISCPSCNATYFVDEGKIPSRGGRLTCPTCGTRWEIFRPGTGEIKAVPIPAEDDVPAATVKHGASAAAPAPDPKVTCPKCGHAFVPGMRPAPAAPGAPAGRKVILLVEDQKYFTELTREALGQEYRTVTVGTKDEAMKVIQSEPPSLLILDLSLARGQDGRDLLRSLPNKPFPVLIFTARDETELYGEAWEELKRLGADDIVHKGMNVGEELKRKVATLLDKR